MAGTGTKRITELTEASNIQSGDYIAVDSNARGTKKVPTSALATSAALTAETNARAGADEQMSERMDGIEEQTALIQNPTKTLSGALVSFTDGANMPMVACTAEIVPKQSGTGTPSPDNVRPISGWTEVKVIVSPTQEATDGHTTTTDLGQTVYGGTLDVVSGVLTVDRAMVTLDGTQEISLTNWRATSTGVGWIYPYSLTNNKVERVDNIVPKLISDSLPTITYGTAFQGTSVGVTTLATVETTPSYGLVVRTADTSLTTASAINLYLSEHPITVCYELATPQTYTLTGQEVSTLLGENNVWADSGDVAITYRRDISIVINNLESALNG